MSIWLFTDVNGNKVYFSYMNEIILERLEHIQENDSKEKLGLQEFDIREDFSINQSFRRGSSMTAQLVQVPTDIIELVNCWKKIEKSKGEKPSFSMMETYADIKILIPKMIKYSALL